MEASSHTCQQQRQAHLGEYHPTLFNDHCAHWQQELQLAQQETCLVGRASRQHGQSQLCWICQCDLTNRSRQAATLLMLTHHPPWSNHWRSSSRGGWAKYFSRWGMLRSSTKIMQRLPAGGPYTPLRRLSILDSAQQHPQQCGYTATQHPVVSTVPLFSAKWVLWASLCWLTHTQVCRTGAIVYACRQPSPGACDGSQTNNHGMRRCK